MGLSMLEQIALQFETYASDQDAMLARNLGSKADRHERRVRAEIWRDAAKELREAGANNRDAFLKEVHEAWMTSKQPGVDILNIFITPPIPAPTPRVAPLNKPQRDIIADIEARHGLPHLAYKQETSDAVIRPRQPWIKVEPNSVWEHRSGRRYEVLMITNDSGDRSVNTEADEKRLVKYPITVVYRNTDDGTLWSGPLSDWHRRMKFVGVLTAIERDEDVQAACVSCGEYHPQNVLEGDHCPACTDTSEPTWPDDVKWISISYVGGLYESQISECGRYERHRSLLRDRSIDHPWVAGKPPK